MGRARPLVTAALLGALALALGSGPVQASSTTTTTVATSTTSTAPSSTTTSTSTTTTTLPPPTGPFGVGVATCTFVDRSRPLPDYATKPPGVRARQRVLVTEIRYPTSQRTPNAAGKRGARPRSRAGGYPLVVFAHGYDVTPDTYERLLDAWVRSGFVVAAPVFPDESPVAIDSQPGVDTEWDLPNEPADLAFVIRQVVGDSASRSGACAVLRGLVDPSAVALAGHSDGADVVSALAASRGRDPQSITYASLRAGLNIRAAIVMEGGELSPGPYAPSRADPSMMVVQSATDTCNAPWNSTHLYAALAGPDKWFLELLHAHHLPPYDAADPTAFRSVAAVTSAYLRLELYGDGSVASLSEVGRAAPAVARIFHAGPGPSIPPVPGPIYCSFN